MTRLGSVSRLTYLKINLPPPYPKFGPKYANRVPAITAGTNPAGRFVRAVFRLDDDAKRSTYRNVRRPQLPKLSSSIAPRNKYPGRRIRRGFSVRTRDRYREHDRSAGRYRGFLPPPVASVRPAVHV